jgi:hypothetical protein
MYFSTNKYLKSNKTNNYKTSKDVIGSAND